MANDFSHRTVSSGTRVFILIACLACLRRVEVRAEPPIDDSIGDFRPVNFDEGPKWIFPRSDESSDDSPDETQDDEAFDRLLRRSREDRDESRSRFFKGSKSEEEIGEKNFNDLLDPEDDSLTILKEKRVALPARFVYVAREFYRSWLIPSLARNSAGNKQNNDESSGGKVEAENGKPIGGTKLGLGWRNIIDAPTSGCPPGERRDQNGRCRMTLW